MYEQNKNTVAKMHAKYNLKIGLHILLCHIVQKGLIDSKKNNAKMTFKKYIFWKHIISQLEILIKKNMRSNRSYPWLCFIQIKRSHLFQSSFIFSLQFTKYFYRSPIQIKYLGSLCDRITCLSVRQCHHNYELNILIYTDGPPPNICCEAHNQHKTQIEALKIVISVVYCRA